MSLVLILEDEPDLRSLFGLVLRDAGYSVLEAGAADEAERLAADHQINALVADLVIPGNRSGAQFARSRQMSQPASKP